MSILSNQINKGKQWSNTHLNTGFATRGAPGIAQALGYPSGGAPVGGVPQGAPPISGLSSFPGTGPSAGSPPSVGPGGVTTPTPPTGGSWWSNLSLSDKLAILGVGLNALGGIGNGIAQSQQIGLEKQQLGLTREQNAQRLAAMQQFRGGLKAPSQFAPQSPFGAVNNP